MGSLLDFRRRVLDCGEQFVARGASPVSPRSYERMREVRRKSYIEKKTATTAEEHGSHVRKLALLKLKLKLVCIPFLFESRIGDVYFTVRLRLATEGACRGAAERGNVVAHSSQAPLRGAQSCTPVRHRPPHYLPWPPPESPGLRMRQGPAVRKSPRPLRIEAAAQGAAPAPRPPSRHEETRRRASSPPRLLLRPPRQHAGCMQTGWLCLVTSLFTNPPLRSPLLERSASPPDTFEAVLRQKLLLYYPGVGRGLSSAGDE